ncbi:hypothetical protein [Roseiconus lacunae]|uniref:hypothetical protein n=1 Tax=Roseiconus lacunae TaxID=2605694 RepID=UPI001E3EF5DE|nr:hypothetical protein [Roseiconus lacunae]MCD0459953.1 hypothetical protein [Roseiconus lacunae]
MATITDPVASQFGKLTRGGYSGREQKLYYDKTLLTDGYTDDAASDEAAAWVEIPHRNLQYTDGPGLGSVEIGDYNFNTPGFKGLTGSFEYVRKRSADAVYAALKSAQRNGTLMRLLILSDALSVANARGVVVPVLLGETPNSGNGADPVLTTFNFGLAEAIDESGNLETDQDVVVATGGTDPVAA